MIPLPLPIDVSSAHFIPLGATVAFGVMLTFLSTSCSTLYSPVTVGFGFPTTVISDFTVLPVEGFLTVTVNLLLTSFFSASGVPEIVMYPVVSE